MNISLIFLAGGKGTRFGEELPKQFFTLLGKAVALHSFDLLTTLPRLVEIAIVCAPTFRHLFPQNIPTLFAEPGQERYHSVENGLSALSDEETLVLIHDAARPNIVLEDILELLSEAKKWGAATLAQKAVQTIKQADQNDFVLQTLDRNTLWEIHTPQCIRKSLLKEGFLFQKEHPHHVTDDVSLIEALGKPVKLVPSSKGNIKITRKEDLHVAERMLQL